MTGLAARLARLAASLVVVALIGCAAPGGPPVAVSSVPSASPAPTETPTPTTAPIVLVPRPFVCVSTDLCYPRVFLSAHVVDQYVPADTVYDVVRMHQYDRLGIWIGGHSGITPMGALFQWQAGDDVEVYGQHYTVFGAAYITACIPFVAPPPAAVYLTTSATTDSCDSGKHENLVVMAR